MSQIIIDDAKNGSLESIKKHKLKKLFITWMRKQRSSPASTLASSSENMSCALLIKQDNYYCYLSVETGLTRLLLLIGYGNPPLLLHFSRFIYFMSFVTRGFYWFHGSLLLLICTFLISLIVGVHLNYFRLDSISLIFVYN